MKWDDFYEDYNETVKKVIEPLNYYEPFHDFLKKLDKTGQGRLIKELFGSEEKYIESPGDFHVAPEEYEYSIIYNFEANAREDDLISLFGFFVRNLRKCFDWTYSELLQKNEDVKDDEH